MTQPQHVSTRRTLLRAMGATLALPIIPRALDLPPLVFSSDLSEVELIARRLVQYRDYPYNPFAAEASIWLGVARLLGVSAALAILLQYLGVRPAFASNVDYTDADGCEPNFENGEYDMRRNRLTSFSGVHRSPLDREIAVLAAKTPDGNGGGFGQQGELGSQVGGARYMTLEGDELSVAQIASDLVRSRHGVSGVELARTVPLTSRRDVLVRDVTPPVPVRVLTNHAGGEVFWDRRPFPQATAGRIVVRLPGRTDPRNLPMVGLRS